MPQSLAAIYLHLVFSTRDRRPWINERSLRADAHAYIGGIADNLGCTPLEIGGVDDHVHALVRLSRTITVADLVREMKTGSSSWMKKRGVTAFAWQSGYGAFSVETAGLEAVRQYIKAQEEHHRRIDFRDEFIRLLTEHGLTWDDRYVWD